MADGNQFGCDIEGMTQLGDSFKTTTDRVRDVVGDLVNCYKGLAWEGPDSEQFKNEVVDSRLKNALDHVLTELEAKRKKVDENKDRQIQISSAA